MNIVVKNLTKKYGPQKAVDDISFEVKTGEILGFLGPNGAGKTTTMKAIVSYISPNSGTIEVGGISVLSNADEIKKFIGYLPENNPLYEDMPVLDYLYFVAELQNIPVPRIKGRILEMVKTCGLEAEKHKKIGELSKGYRQRVGLAQALIHDPQVLILDEPTSGLDPNQIVEIRELIRSIGKEKTVILSSHILAEVEATCDRIMIISKGKIVANGSPEQLRKQATGREILRLSIEDGNKNDIFKALQEVGTVEVVDFSSRENSSFEIQSKPGATSRREIFQLCKNKGWVLTEMTPIETKLEDIFRELTLN
ncbi:MAG TPA: ATP-binding cassette domain-containing protein [Bacteroidales bacterium]